MAVAAKGNTNAVTDAGVAALLSEARCKGAAFNVRVNVSALSDKSLGTHLERESLELVARASHAAAKAYATVEKALTS